MLSGPGLSIDLIEDTALLPSCWRGGGGGGRRVVEVVEEVAPVSFGLVLSSLYSGELWREEEGGPLVPPPTPPPEAAATPVRDGGGAP